MLVTSVKVEDRLDGVSNFLPWKERILVILKKQDKREFVSKPPLAPMQASKSTQTSAVVDPAAQQLRIRRTLRHRG